MQHLPARGPAYQAVNGHAWHDTEYLLAQLVDDVRRIPTAIFRAQGAKAKEPKPIQRPGDKPRNQIGDRGDRPVEDVIAYLNALNPRGA